MNEKPTCQACGQPAAQTSIIGRTCICESCRPVVMAELDALRADGKSVDVGRIAYRRYAMRPPDPIQKNIPSSEAIREFLKHYGITGAQAARMAYLSGGQAVRKYTGGRKPHRMSGAVWFSLHAHVLLPPETIAEIETAMRQDLDVQVTA